MTTHPTDTPLGTPRTDPAEELTQAIDIDMYQAGFMLELDEREVVLNAVRKYLTHQTAILRQKDEALRELTETIDAHEIESLDCDRSGDEHCNCLRKANDKAKAALTPKSPTP